MYSYVFKESALLVFIQTIPVVDLNNTTIVFQSLMDLRRRFHSEHVEQWSFPDKNILDTENS